MPNDAQQRQSNSQGPALVGHEGRPRRRAAQVANAHLAAQLQTRRQQQAAGATTTGEAAVAAGTRATAASTIINNAPANIQRRRRQQQQQQEQQQQQRRTGDVARTRQASRLASGMASNSPILDLFPATTAVASINNGRLSPATGPSPRWLGATGGGHMRSPSPTLMISGHQGSPILDAREPYLLRRGTNGGFHHRHGTDKGSPLAVPAAEVISGFSTNASTDQGPQAPPNSVPNRLAGVAAISASDGSNIDMLGRGVPPFPLATNSTDGDRGNGRSAAMGLGRDGCGDHERQARRSPNATLVTYLRQLCQHAIQMMAWTTAIVWAERLLWLTDDLEDLYTLLWAYISAGQYRVADQWIQQARYRDWIPRHPGCRYLASIVAARMGRALDTLTILTSIADEDTIKLATHSTAAAGSSASNPNGGRDRVDRQGTALAPAAATPTSNPVVALSSMATPSLGEAMPIWWQPSSQLRIRSSTVADDDAYTDDSVIVPGLSELAYALYLRGLGLVQAYTTEGGLDGPNGDVLASIVKSILADYDGRGGATDSSGAPLPFLLSPPPKGLLPSLFIPQPQGGGSHNTEGSRLDGRKEDQLTVLGAIKACWVKSVLVDPRVMESWASLRHYGLLSPREEMLLIAATQWSKLGDSSSRGESDTGKREIGEYFRDYLLATIHTTVAIPAAPTAGREAFEGGDHLPEDLASPDLALDRLIRRHSLPNGAGGKPPGLSVAMDPALLVPRSARMLAAGRPAEALELADQVLEGPVSSLSPSFSGVIPSSRGLVGGRSMALRFPFHTGALTVKIGALTLLGLKKELYRMAHFIGDYLGVSAMGASHNQAAIINASIASGAAISGTGEDSAPFLGGGVNGPATVNGRLRRGLSSVPVYSCQLGPPTPVGGVDVGAAPLSISPATEPFPGQSLAWYAIGCYYLACAGHLIYPGQTKAAYIRGTRTRSCSERYSALSSLAFMSGVAIIQQQQGRSADQGESRPVNGSTGANVTEGIAGFPIPPAAERALTEARRWLAKCTWTASRSVDAWVAFAHTFILAREWESATRALYMALSLAGLGGGEAAISAGHGNDPQSRYDARKPASSLSQAALVPLVSLGGVYLRMGNLPMSKDCFDSAVRYLTVGRSADECAEVLLRLGQRGARGDSSTEQRQIKYCLGVNPILLNELGTVYYLQERYREALALLELALDSLHNEHSHVSDPTRPWSHDPLQEGEPAACRCVLEITVLLNLAHTYRRLGELHKSLEYFDRAVASDEENVDAITGAAFTRHLAYNGEQCAKGSQSAHLLDEAIELYHRALALRPGGNSSNGCGDGGGINNGGLVGEALDLALEQAAKIKLSTGSRGGGVGGGLANGPYDDTLLKSERHHTPGPFRTEPANLPGLRAKTPTPEYAPPPHTTTSHGVVTPDAGPSLSMHLLPQIAVPNRQRQLPQRLSPTISAANFSHQLATAGNATVDPRAVDIDNSVAMAISMSNSDDAGDSEQDMEMD